MSHPARRLAPALALLVLLLVPASPAAAAGWTCEGSALRGTVLGQATIEPLTANKGAETCTPARAGLAGLTAGLPLPLAVTALGAETTVENADQPLGKQKVAALGGIADLRVRPLGIPLPAPDFSAVPAITIPGVGSVDLKPTLQGLVQGLPSADLVRIQGLVAYADGQCSDGAVFLTGTSRVAGLTVLGQELQVNQAVERTLTLIDSQNIDPSNVPIDSLLPPGVTLDPVTRALVQQALDAIPSIPIPATVATVKITPAQTIRDGGRLTQRALQVQVGLLGQSLVDLVIGEASVGADGVACVEPGTPESAAESALQCTTRRLVLADVIPGRRVRLLGYADKRYIGRTVDIHFIANGRRVARARVRDDGSFSATAPMPSRRLRSTDRARYQARLGSERSLRLKLMRRMQVFSVRARGRQVSIAGRVVPPLSRPVRSIEVRRRISCSKWQVVKRIKPSRTGRFRTTVAGPPSQLAATYRFATRVRSSARGKSRKTFETFTLPRFVDLG
ncbi:MAG TPA: hypothetical protein VF529_13595 [Solirubrobacteraceae bacterium]